MYAEINDVRIAYDERAEVDRPAVLLVHGFPLDRTMWAAQLEGLASQSHVIAPDLRGHGESDSPPGPYSMDKHADDLAALLDHLRVERAVIAGLSMGGYVALAMWRRHPQRIAGLGLVDTRAEADSPEARAKREVTAGQVREIGVRVLADDMLPRLLAAHNQGNERIAGPLYEMILRQPAEGMIGALAAMRDRIDSTDTLPTITVPTTVIVGDADVIAPRADAERMATLIPQARLVIVPGAGHMSPVEDAETVNRALAELAARVG